MQFLPSSPFSCLQFMIFLSVISYLSSADQISSISLQNDKKKKKKIGHLTPKKLSVILKSLFKFICLSVSCSFSFFFLFLTLKTLLDFKKPLVKLLFYGRCVLSTDDNYQMVWLRNTAIHLNPKSKIQAQTHAK